MGYSPERRTAVLKRMLPPNNLLYAKARTQKPERWSGKTRNWQPAGPVWLNPERENSASEIRDAA